MILGGNGYLGSKVVRNLLNDGHTVVCTRRRNSDLSRLSDLEEKIIWISTSVEAIDSAVQSIPFDYVLNMACNYGRGSTSSDYIIESNLEFPLMVLNRTVAQGVKNFMTIGTGLPKEFNMYSFSKNVYGSFGKFYAEKDNINFLDLKLEMFYGVDEPRDRFLPSIIIKMLRGENVETTLGTQKRDIVAVKDIIRAIIQIINSGIKGYKEIPIGTGESPRISEIIDYVWEETGKKSILYKGAIPMRTNEPDCVADTTFLQSIIEWNPIDWKSGIREMIHEMKITEENVI